MSDIPKCLRASETAGSEELHHCWLYMTHTQHTLQQIATHQLLQITTESAISHGDNSQGRTKASVGPGSVVKM